jgi:hypothetical protein
MKKFFIAVIVGFLFGATLAGLFSPAMVSWYFNPPTAIGISCKDAVIWGIAAYQKLVLIGGVIGIVFAAALALTTKKSTSKETTPSQQSPN